MFPLKDLNPTRITPWLTYLFIALCVIVFGWEYQLAPAELNEVFRSYSVVPALLMADPISLEAFLDLTRSMFFHGGFAHLGGNMLYLFIFGDNIEEKFGRLGYVFLYFTGGVAAALAQVATGPDSQIPLVGASGAIAAVLGAYLVFFPTIKVRGLVMMGRFTSMQDWPAFVVLGMWFGIQLLSGVGSLGAEGGGVAFFAHVGGFVWGAALALVLKFAVPQPDREESYQNIYRRLHKP